jgi:hypothetical protein
VFESKSFEFFYIFIERGVAEMLIHEVSSGQKLLEVVVADVNGDGHADGGPGQKTNKNICIKECSFSNRSND